MKWLKITVVFFLVTLVKCGPTRSEVDDDPVPIQITSIERVATKTKICIGVGIIAATESYTLSISTKEGAINYEAVADGDPNCITFPADLGTLIPTKDYRFIVHSETHRENYAEGAITNFPKIPFDWSYTMMNDPLTNAKYLLRAKGAGVQNLELTGATMLVTDADIAYYHEITTFPFTTKPCIKTEPKDTDFCDDEIKIPLKIPVNPVAFESATLELDNPAVNLLLKAMTGDESFDIIVTDKNDQLNKFCPSQPNTLSCPVTRTDHETDIFNIRVIKNTEDAITAIGSVIIHDRDLYLSHIGDDILEGIWVHTHEKTDTSKNYQFHLFDGVPGTPVTVDCTHLHETHCYGYITGLANVKHSMKVKPIAGTGPKITDENQNTYEPATPQELAILSRHMTRHANQLMADVNICFQHLIPQEGGAFSHYEMLIINEKGQWLKHRILEEEEVSEGRLCFAPFTINTKDFDLTEGTKVVISQRGVDGFTVLATGEAKLL